MVYNILSCSGFDVGSAGGWVAGGGCLKSRIGLVLLFFIIALVRKWGGEEIGLGFSFLFGLIFGIGGYIMVVFVTGAFKWALAAGILGMLVGGYGGGVFFGGGEDG